MTTPNRPGAQIRQIYPPVLTSRVQGMAIGRSNPRSAGRATLPVLTSSGQEWHFHIATVTAHTYRADQLADLTPHQLNTDALSTITPNLADLPPSQSSIDVLSTVTPNLANQAPSQSSIDALSTITPNLADLPPVN